GHGRPRFSFSYHNTAFITTTPVVITRLLTARLPFIHYSKLIAISTTSSATHPLFVRAYGNVDSPNFISLGSRVSVCAINWTSSRWCFGIIKWVKWLEKNWVVFEVVADENDYGTYLPTESFLLTVHHSSTHLPRHLHVQYSFRLRFNRLPIKIAHDHKVVPILCCNQIIENPLPKSQLYTLPNAD
ncbi:hypothetical protein BJ138DRAFT_1167171, partial [Hygrophoropsis aurantiaca]